MDSLSNQSHSPRSSSDESTEYRMVRKAYHCHMCDRDFKKMAPVNDLVEVACPHCNETFCEEVTTANASPSASPQESQPQANPASTTEEVRSDPPSPPAQQRSVESPQQMLLNLLGNGRSFSQMQQQQQEPSRTNATTGRIITSRRIIVDETGASTIIEDVMNNGVLLRRSITTFENPTQQQQQQAPARNGVDLFFMLDPSSLFGNANLNFRSFASDENILQHILRLSEQQRGRSGTPPASKDAVKNLPEVNITDSHCKVSEESKEYPRCSICCEDLTDKATQLPCGHLFNSECISQWLGEHNQCPVCRHELPTDDQDYERMKAQRQQQNSSPQSQ